MTRYLTTFHNADGNHAIIILKKDVSASVPEEFKPSIQLKPLSQKKLFTDVIFCFKTKRICLSSRTIGFQLRGPLRTFDAGLQKNWPVSSVVKTLLLVQEV